MSYSFSVRAPTKNGADLAVTHRLIDVLSGQPKHEADIPDVKVAAAAFIRLLPEPAEDEEVVVTMHGSVGWRMDQTITSASVSISAQVMKKAPVTAR